MVGSKVENIGEYLNSSKTENFFSFQSKYYQFGGGEKVNNSSSEGVYFIRIPKGLQYLKFSILIKKNESEGYGRKGNSRTTISFDEIVTKTFS